MIRAWIMSIARTPYKPPIAREYDWLGLLPLVFTIAAFYRLPTRPRLRDPRRVIRYVRYHMPSAIPSLQAVRGLTPTSHRVFWERENATGRTTSDFWKRTPSVILRKACRTGSADGELLPLEQGKVAGGSFPGHAYNATHCGGWQA